MVNSALDEDLVRQIWDVINERQTKNTLRTLKIHTYGGSAFGDIHSGDLSTIVEHVSRSYLVTANPGIEGGIEIVELSKRRRETIDAKSRNFDRKMIEKWGEKG